jgi:sulfoxide reductase heme-binding subunit YedZ
MPGARQINSALRRIPVWAVYLLGVVPAAWFFCLGMTGGLGVEPIRELELRLGRVAIKLLVLVLTVTPLRNATGVSLLRFRRAFGLLLFFYVVLHLLVWLFLDVGIWSQIRADIVKRPFVTIGMAALLLMIPLALTSNDWAIRKLGAMRWKRLHRLTYAAAVLGALHFVILVKGFRIDTWVYLAIILGLLALRVPRNRPRVPA